MNILPRKVIPPQGHKTSGTPYMMFMLYCECGWHTAPNPERSGAYSEWRTHALQHGGTLETYEAHQKREAAHLRKLTKARTAGNGEKHGG